MYFFFFYLRDITSWLNVLLFFFFWNDTINLALFNRVRNNKHTLDTRQLTGCTFFFFWEGQYSRFSKVSYYFFFSVSILAYFIRLNCVFFFFLLNTTQFHREPFILMLDRHLTANQQLLKITTRFQDPVYFISGFEG